MDWNWHLNVKLIADEIGLPKMGVHRSFTTTLNMGVWQVLPDIAITSILCHDNVPSHISLAVREFLTQKNIPTLLTHSTVLTWHHVIFFVLQNQNTPERTLFRYCMKGPVSPVTRTLNSLSHEDLQHRNEEWQCH